MEIHCHLCSHVWDYKGTSTARYISCPKCLRLVKNPRFNMTEVERLTHEIDTLTAKRTALKKQ